MIAPGVQYTPVLHFVSAASQSDKGHIVNQDNSGSKEEHNESIPFWRVILSVIQASFGVQNKKNLERDFAKGKFLAFAIAAFIFTAMFVLGLILVVKLVLA
ncbi:MAG: DUF2970 domain-containing protein [Pseudomonadales bacterium]|nr:DUF2970 domain-containing protein [Pseudomonadales bacterium]